MLNTNITGNWQKHEDNLFKKVYYRCESVLLKNYESIIAKKAVLIAVSSSDAATFKSELGAIHIHVLPVFLPYDTVQVQRGKGCFCLYHGNLAINENEKAADWLINEVFNGLNIPLVIAGRNPSLPLQTLAHASVHTCMVVNPSEVELQDLIRKAQVHVLPSFNNTGVKLKLLNALYNGRFCLVNNAAVEGSGINGLCHIAETAPEFSKQVEQLYNDTFSENDSSERQQVLQLLYDNKKNALQLMSWIY